jgi:uncharacterized protein YbjT (DUF2867 family)
MTKVAIVVGATGLVGRNLVDKLANAEYIDQVITLTRSPAKHGSSKVSNHVIKFDDLSSYIELFKGDYLFSCLGTTFKQAGSVAAQRKVDLEYQLNVAKIAAQQGVKHYLLVSSTGANMNSGRAYLKMKGELEDQVKALPFKHISIFQPSLLIGERSDFRLAEKIGSRVMPLLCRIPWLRRFRPITGEQVAEKMVQVSQQNGNRLEFFCLDELFT